MSFFDGDKMKTHQYDIRSHLCSWRPTRQPLITLIVAVVLLQPIVESKWDAKYLKPCEFNNSEDSESTEGNIVLILNNRKRLDTTCNLNPYDENVRMLFRNVYKPEQWPSTRIVFYRFVYLHHLVYVEQYDMEYVFVINKYSARLVMPNPPLGDSVIKCFLLTDAYFTTNVNDDDKSDSPYLYSVCRNQLMVLDLSVTKINIIGTTDTTIDIKLEMPRTFDYYKRDDNTFLLNYYIEDNQTQIDGLKIFANNDHYMVMNDTVVRLENLKTDTTYSITTKYCTYAMPKHQYCSDYTIPIRVKTDKGPLGSVTIQRATTTTSPVTTKIGTRWVVRPQQPTVDTLTRSNL